MLKERIRTTCSPLVAVAHGFFVTMPVVDFVDRPISQGRHGNPGLLPPSLGFWVPAVGKVSKQQGQSCRCQAEVKVLPLLACLPDIAPFLSLFQFSPLQIQDELEGTNGGVLSNHRSPNLPYKVHGEGRQVGVRRKAELFPAEGAVRHRA